MSGCLFCNIVNKEIPANLIYEDDKVLAFKDINPQSPVHFLVIPKEHIDSINSVEEGNKEVLGHILYTISKLAKEQNLESGYRIVNNCGKDGGQTVNHIHFHVLGGREMMWPPG